MKRHYNEPDIQVENFVLEDVLTTSDNIGGAGGSFETPEHPIG